MNPSQKYTIEVIATGYEILLGRITDTNSSWIARKAAERGAMVKRIVCVGDDVDEIASAVKESLSRRVNLIITTGGLGPSMDDLTIESVGKALERRVEVNPKARAMLEQKCKELGVELTSRRERMARLLEGAIPLYNPVGMAPGMMIKLGASTIIAMPGIPEEMKAIFETHVEKIIEEDTHSRRIAKTIVARIVWREFFPIYESLIRDFPHIYIKNKAIPPVKAEERDSMKEIQVDIVVEAQSVSECESKMRVFLEEFKKRLKIKDGELFLINV
ncbi:MAG: competence/damage-inducible protein A [Candidatus Bathyarchaeia archaeon]